MIQNRVLSSSSLGVSKITARTAVALAATFLAIVFLLHFLEPKLVPSWAMFSNYGIWHYGWLMMLAFFCWGGSALALLAALWPSFRTMGGRIGRWWLLLIGIAVFGVGILNAITPYTSRTVNELHTWSGGAAIVTFPIAASLIAGSLARNQAWASARRRLLRVTLLVWFGMLAFVGSNILYLAIDPSASMVVPEVLMYLFNRFVVIAYMIWLIIVALHAALLPRQIGTKSA